MHYLNFKATVCFGFVLYINKGFFFLRLPVSIHHENWHCPQPRKYIATRRSSSIKLKINTNR